MLPLIAKIIGSEKLGLYRDDGLSIFRNASGPKLEKIKKHIQKIFQQKMLGVTIKCDSKIVNYFDVSLNLNVGIYKAFKKPNNETVHIHVDSNYPPSVIKKIPKSIAARLFSLSSSKEKFMEAVQSYKQNLVSCGSREKLTYVEQSVKNQKETRKINIIWSNPP